MFDWNVSPSPLDGAIVEKRGGGGSLFADVNKNSHFKPVCALSDHSKHYARHRGWTTLDWNHVFCWPWRNGGNTDRAPMQVYVFHHSMFSSHSWLFRSLSCVVSCAITPLPIASPSRRKKGKEVRLWRLFDLVASWRLNVRRGASVTNHIFTHSDFCTSHRQFFINRFILWKVLLPFQRIPFFSANILSPGCSQMGGAVNLHSWGFMQSPLHHQQQPGVTKSQTPLLLAAELD